MRLILCLLLAACTQNGKAPTQKPPIGQGASPYSQQNSTDKAENPVLSVGITIKGTADQIARMTRIIEEVDQIVASKDFGDAVLAHRYNGKPGFASTDKTPSQVLQDARSGAEKTMGLSIEFKRHRSNDVTAWTYPSGKIIWFNSTRLGRDDASVAATLRHEMLHKVGYSHDSSATNRRPYSVPYALGKIVRDIWKERKR